MLKGLMNTHNAQQHQDISLRRRVAPLRHQHSDNDFNDSDHCAKLNKWPPSETNIWWTTTDTKTDGSSHCKLTIWKVSPQNTQHCCRDPDLKGPADPNTQWVWQRAQWWDSATSIWSHHNKAVSATGWQHLTSTTRLLQQPKGWQPPTRTASATDWQQPPQPEGRTFSTAKFKHFW